MNRTVGRIFVSRNPDELFTLAAQVFEKHQKDGNASPLLHLNGFDWAETGPTIDEALALHRNAELYKGLMEKAYCERDLLIPAIEKTVKASRNLLKALNQKNPKRLSDWGYQVDDSIPPPKTSKKK